MTSRELREFFDRAGPQALEETNRALGRENYSVEAWAEQIADPYWETKFCHHWGFPTEVEKAAATAAANLSYQQWTFWLAVAVALMTLATLILTLSVAMRP